MYYSTVLAYATLIVVGCQPILSKIVMANKGDNLGKEFNYLVANKRGIYISNFNNKPYEYTSRRIAFVLNVLEEEGYKITRVWNEPL